LFVSEKDSVADPLRDINDENTTDEAPNDVESWNLVPPMRIVSGKECEFQDKADEGQDSKRKPMPRFHIRFL
jgi:hypothetical protein